MDQRDKIMQVAASQVGYKEYSGDNNKYGVWYGMNSNPWCAMFVSWCAAQAGISTSIIPKMAYVPYMVKFFQSRGLYRARGSYTPKKGDIVFFGDSGHVGLVESVSGNNVITIEGNTSSGGNVSNGEGVYRRTRPLGSGSWVMGFGVPAYIKIADKKEDEKVDVKKVALKSLDTGSLVEVEAINHNGSNYIKLRDVEKFMPAEIGYDGKNPTFKLKYK